MTRSVLAMAIALVSGATLLGPAAEACISCNYTPEVVNTPVGPAKARPKRVAKPKQAPAKEYGARPAQKRVAKRPPAAKDVKEATTPEATKETATETQTDAASGKTTPVERQADTDAATDTSTAALAESEKSAAQPKSGDEGGCKKFSATAGKTVSVPCE